MKNNINSIYEAEQRRQELERNSIYDSLKRLEKNDDFNRLVKFYIETKSLSLITTLASKGIDEEFIHSQLKSIAMFSAFLKEIDTNYNSNGYMN